MKLTDALGRRHRYAPRQPRKDENPVLTENDLRALHALQAHYVLPSHYLFAFSGLKDRTNFTKRLGKYLRHKWGYIELASAQENAGNRLAQNLTYRLTPRGKEILAETGQLNRYTPPLDNWSAHQLMTATATASIDLACRRLGFRYISTEEIMTSDQCVHKKVELQTRAGSLIPDKLFGIEYSNGKRRYFALEADRAGKDWERIDRKLAKYAEIERERPYRDAWGIPRLAVLFFTSSRHRAEEILRRGNSLQYLVRHNTAFSTWGWHVPPIMYELLDEPWQCIDGVYHINRA